MRRLLLIRHGESVWNASGRWQGWADPPLSARGIAQAIEAANQLSGQGLTAVASSDLRRARHTAEIVAEKLGLRPVIVQPGLRERDVGDWSGLAREEIEARWPGHVEAWRRGEIPAPPGGETTPAFVERVVAALGTVIEAAPHEGDLLVVTHGGAMRALERHASVEAQRTANLCGRWFNWTEESLTADELVVLISSSPVQDNANTHEGTLSSLRGYESIREHEHEGER